MNLVLVRHAEVLKEYIGKYNGHIDIPLSSDGKLQAKKLALTLKDMKFDKIYCSDLTRAKETLDAFHIDATKIIYTDRLREKSWGKHEGKSFQEIENSGIKYIDFQQWIDALDGQNMQEYILDINDYFETTILKEKCENILVVTHAGAIRSFLSVIKNISLEETFNIKIPYGSYLKV